jgi:hypothetical protein
MIELDASYRFVPAALSAEEAARRGLGAGSGWDKTFGSGLSSCFLLDIIYDSEILQAP